MSRQNMMYLGGALLALALIWFVWFRQPAVTHAPASSISSGGGGGILDSLTRGAAQMRALLASVVGSKPTSTAGASA